MFSRLKFKRATQFTLLATGLMISSILVLYVMLIADLSGRLHELEIVVNAATFLGAQHLLIFAITVIIAFTVSSIIIENVLNPLREMIAKMREVGEMNFGSPLIIDADDDELREFAFTFNVMAAKLNRYIEMQKRFVSDASHELATPITVINGHADLLLRHGFEKNEGSLATIKQEIMRMNALVDSLLLLARSDSNEQKYNFEMYDISTLLNETVTESKLLHSEILFETNVQSELAVRCDELAIRRVMRILISNAVKYACAERAAKIKVSAHENGGVLNISVADNGIGISEEHLPRIFERFYRADPSRNRNSGGSGLGLAIAKALANQLGAGLSAGSVQGEYTEFLLIFETA
jgi:signal transduction histidine kinase